MISSKGKFDEPSSSAYLHAPNPNLYLPLTLLFPRNHLWDPNSKHLLHRQNISRIIDVFPLTEIDGTTTSNSFPAIISHYQTIKVLLRYSLIAPILIRIESVQPSFGTNGYGFGGIGATSFNEEDRWMRSATG